MDAGEAGARLLARVLRRYGSIEELVLAVRADPCAQTMLLPVIGDPDEAARSRQGNRSGL